MSKVVVESVEAIIFKLEVLMREAKSSPEPRLLVNADAIVIEYNDALTGAKVFEKVARLAEK